MKILLIKKGRDYPGLELGRISDESIFVFVDVTRIARHPGAVFLGDGCICVFVRGFLSIGLENLFLDSGRIGSFHGTLLLMLDRSEERGAVLFVS
jgi:hypothetical protein